MLVIRIKTVAPTFGGPTTPTSWAVPSAAPGANGGFTQQELADRLGVGRMTLSRLERGDSVAIETAMRALSECGYAIAVAPKFSRLVVRSRPQTPVTGEPADG